MRSGMLTLAEAAKKEEVSGMKKINKAAIRRQQAWQKQQKWEQFKARIAEAQKQWDKKAGS